jgi:hypothetical protein
MASTFSDENPELERHVHDLNTAHDTMVGILLGWARTPQTMESRNELVNAAIIYNAVAANILMICWGIATSGPASPEKK